MQFLNSKWRCYSAGTTLYFAPKMWSHQRVTISDKNAPTSLWLDQLLYCVRVFVLMCGLDIVLTVAVSCTLIAEKVKFHQVAVLLVICR